MDKEDDATLDLRMGEGKQYLTQRDEVYSVVLQIFVLNGAELTSACLG
jgi:hypothetical protein